MSKLLRTVAILSIIIIPLFSFIGCAIGQYNAEQTKRVEFETQFRNRTAQYSKLGKILKGKGFVVKANDSAFLNMINAFMENRKDGANVGMKWIRESYPNVDATKVQELYADLGRTIESERNSFFETEKILSDIKGQHDLMLRRFPGSILHSFFGTKPIEYNIISDSKTNEAVKTGVDDDGGNPFK